MVRPSPTGQYNILCNHLHFNEQGVEEVMPIDTKYIAIVRHPGTCFYIAPKLSLGMFTVQMSVIAFVLVCLWLFTFHLFLTFRTGTHLQRRNNL